MLIQGAANKNRTNYLVEKYCSLIDRGINAEEILVLLQNPYKKNNFINEIKSNLKTTNYENPQIHTFYGLCYNMVLNFWPTVENTLNIGETTITPNLCGLEISRFLLGHAIKEADFKDYNSKLNLQHQLFRRHALISNNNLSEKQVLQRSYILNEVFAKDAQKALTAYKTKTVQYRAFDYLRQLNIFNYIYQNTDCFQKIKYLILDDADEITPVEFDFIKYLYSQLKETLIAYDKHGSSRMGFLSTDINTVKDLEKTFSAEKTINLDEITTPLVQIKQESYTRRQEMIQKALDRIDKLLKNGAKPSEISIITPIIDSSLKFAIKEFFEQKAINFQFITGNEKLCENLLVKNCLTALKLSLLIPVDIFEIRSILSEILQIPIKYCLSIIEEYKNNLSFKNTDLGYEVYTQKFNNLMSVINDLQSEKLSLSEKIYIFHEKILSDNNFGSIFEKNIYEKFVFFAKQVNDFETVFKEYKFNKTFQKTILNQIANSIISENPSSSTELKEDAVIISTAQKIIDFSYATKYQLWLDTTSQEWMHDDFGTLYNAWVFQRSWKKDSFLNEDNLFYSETKVKKTIRKLALLSKETIYTFSSMYDRLGAENDGKTEKLVISVCNKPKEENDTQNNIQFTFTPRDDQKPVLTYKKGNMAISAVPGAGKTTILLALIIKLIKEGISGENIFVLTYMDSAAKNFKERIKKACPNLEKLPNISTIHGLALRILKENANYVKAGLDENFDVCDDIQRQRILREVLAQCLGENDDFDKYDRGISVLKLSSLSKKPYTKDIELQKFLKVFDLYNSTLKKKNLIDYEDMLVFSVKILEQNPDIAQYYQEICQYIIEDEAQDSSAIQQKLLSILSAKHQNLIRCGDINQAITTTFTNTDLDGFRKFINQSQNVMMTYSQRCTKEIFELANNVVKYASENDLYKNAFWKTEMKEVEGKNPISSNAIISKVFNDYNDERSFILENIRNIFAFNNDATVAILVRNNSQAEEFTSYLAGFGFNIIANNESLNKQPIFNLLYALIKYCVHPWNNETVINFAQVLQNQKFLKLSDYDLSFLKNLKTPFILQNQDEVDSQTLVQLLWDLNYWLENTDLNDIENFSIKAGMYYYRTEIEKSNIYLASAFFKSIMSQYSNIDGFINRIEEIKSRPISTKYSFFDEEQEITKTAKGSIQIMTYHKSKGSEFDYVFIPALNEEFLQFNPNNIKIKSKERFIEAIKALSPNYTKKDESQLKTFQIEENLRLLYVAITRAKQKLYITSAQNCKKFSKVKKTQPSMIFDKLLNQTGAKNVL